MDIRKKHAPSKMLQIFLADYKEMQQQVSQGNGSVRC